MLDILRNSDFEKAFDKVPQHPNFIRTKLTKTLLSGLLTL